MKRAAVLALVAGAIVLSGMIPDQRVYQRDPGIFSYIGEQLLAGKALYRDAWDSKGPFIFYLYALGIGIGGHSGWGIVLLNYLFVYAAILFGEAGLRKAFGPRAAAIGTLGWLAGLLITGSYLGIEMAALPFEFAALYFYVRFQLDRESIRYLVLIGITGALAFLSRPNDMGMQLSIAILIFFSGFSARQWKMTAIRLLALLLGFLIPLTLVAAYFASQHTLGDLIDASIVYNVFYSDTTMLSRAVSVLYGLAVLSGVTLTAAAGFLLSRINSFRCRLRSDQRSLLALALVDLPVEIVLATLSGRNYTHYYVLWLPVFAILITFLIYVLLEDSEFFKQEFHLGAWRDHGLLHFPFTHVLLAWLDSILDRLYARNSILIALSILLAINGLSFRISRIWNSLGPDRNKSVVEFIQSHTKPGDFVLMWAADIEFNFLAERPSPGPYAHLYPLFTQGYQTPAMVEGLLAELVQDQPMVIDCSSSDMLSPPIDDAQRLLWRPYVGNWGLIPEMDDVFKYIHAHYERVGVVGPYDWVVYVYNDN
jgi:hypothetical protein